VRPKKLLLLFLLVPHPGPLQGRGGKSKAMVFIPLLWGEDLGEAKKTSVALFVGASPRPSPVERE